ncbi:MAG: ABC transporter ATP-binding protein [Pseudomonadota bacterium]
MIRLDELTKIFQTPSGDITAADRINMEVPEGNICVLLGPSGCGKTTTMKMVNRLVEPTSGKIFIGDEDVTAKDPIELRRNIGYVIQQIGLFPNQTIEDNICAVPDMLGWDRKKSRARAAELLEMVALDPGTFLKRFPKELSGGQQQRVGVIRALAADPPVMLMDEPFGAIDPINREVIQDEFLKMQSDIKKTIMFVSHDIDEAVKMADKIAIFDAGKLIQYDSPDDLLAHPKNAFIADFVGGDRTLKRLRLITVADAMMKDPPRVTADDSLSKAVSLMEEHGHISIVMVGPKGRARGVVYLSDARGAKGKVGENHKKLPGTVHMDEDLRTAVSSMFMHDETSLACVDSDGIYKGYVTQRGITHILGATYRDA